MAGVRIDLSASWFAVDLIIHLTSYPERVFDFWFKILNRPRPVYHCRTAAAHVSITTSYRSWQANGCFLESSHVGAICQFEGATANRGHFLMVVGEKRNKRGTLKGDIGDNISRALPRLRGREVAQTRPKPLLFSFSSFWV